MSLVTQYAACIQIGPFEGVTNLPIPTALTSECCTVGLRGLMERDWFEGETPFSARERGGPGDWHSIVVV